MAKNTNPPQTREAYAQNIAKSKKVKKKHGLFYKIFMTILTLGILALIGGGALFAYYAKDAPKVTKEDLTSGNSSIFYDTQNQIIKTLGDETREYVTSDKIPQQLKDAVVSIEDRRFYSHIGVDPIRIVGAAFSNITGSSLGLQGGSTLTQQLVKLSVFSTKKSDQTLQRKAQEAWLALKVEHNYSKDEILEFYINKVYLNNGVYGMGTAAEYYYGKSLKKLDLAQIALIAGIPQQPAGYDPYLHPDKATLRRNLVLDAMVESKKITQSQANTAKNEDIKTGLVDQSQAQSTNVDNAIIDAYIKETITEVQDKLGLDPYRDGLKIYTNLNMDVQRRLYDIVNTNNYVNFPDDAMQTGVAMTDAKNGKVIAMIGGRKLPNIQLGNNRAVSISRSNGSTMKPLMDYGPAIEYLDWSTYEQVYDTKYVYPGTNIQLYDWDNLYNGRMSMRTALRDSRNVPAIRTLETVGLTKATEFLKGLGITNAKGFEIQNGIGAGVSPVEEATAYAAFSNGGTYYKPQYVNKIVTSDGISRSFSDSGTRAMKSSTAYMITDMLKDVISDGTGTNAQIANLYQAGKTGTTNYSAEEIAQNPALSGLAKDSWFAGYTKKYSIAVWTGYDYSNKQGLSYANQTIASKIYKNLMQFATQNDSASTDWTIPDGVAEVNIVRGSNPAIVASSYSSYATRELFVEGTQPVMTSSPSGSSSSNSAESADTDDSSPSGSSSSRYPGNSQSNNSSASSSSAVTNSSSSSVVTRPEESSSSESTPAGDGGDGSTDE